MAQKVEVPGELYSGASEQKVADATQIKDESRQNKSQKAINDELSNGITQLNNTIKNEYAKTICLTQAQYAELEAKGEVDDNTYYMIVEE